MSIVIDKTAEPNTLGLLSSSSFDFYLGGSRFMHEKYPHQFPIGIDTDWDFYCDDSPQLRNFLHDAGFIMSSDSVYFDDECLAIFKHRENIQVVIRRDAKFYRNVMVSINPDYYYNDLWKSSPTMSPATRLLIGARFNQLFAIAHSFE